MPYSPTTGGHAPDNLRKAFEMWIDAHWPKNLASGTIKVDSTYHSIEWLTGQLWNCTDILPRLSCDALALPQGSTYAQAVRHIHATQGNAKSGRA
jgi:hypothetical protein